MFMTIHGHKSHSRAHSQADEVEEVKVPVLLVKLPELSTLTVLMPGLASVISPHQVRPARNKILPPPRLVERPAGHWGEAAQVEDIVCPGAPPVR